MKIYILKNDNSSFERYFLHRMQHCLPGVEVLSVYRCTNTMLGDYLIQQIIKRGEQFEKTCYGSWKRRIKDGDTVILFDNLFSLYILKYLRERFPNSRIIFWLWNIGKSDEIAKYKEMVEVWCFDKAECEKYGYKYNIQFHVGLYPRKIKRQTTYDFVYVGRDKGRQALLNEIVQELDKNGMTYNIHIVKPERKEFSHFHYHNHSLKYQRYLKILSGAKVIIDITQDNQEGMTLRLLEALLLKRKILTNNPHYIEYGMVDRNDIFVWGLDDDLQLGEFCNSSFCSLKENDMLNKWYGNFHIRRKHLKT